MPGLTRKSAKNKSFRGGEKRHADRSGRSHMHNIKKSILIKSSPDRVFSVVRDIENYPVFIRDIKSVEVRSRSSTRLISKWLIDIEGADVAWQEEDLVDEKNKRLSFNLLEGDYEKYEGEWSVAKDGFRSRLSDNMILDWGIPSFEKVIGPVLEKKTDKIVRGLLCAIKRYCEKSKVQAEK